MVSVVVAHECKNRLQTWKQTAIYSLFLMENGGRFESVAINKYGLVAQLVERNCLLNSGLRVRVPSGPQNLCVLARYLKYKKKFIEIFYNLLTVGLEAAIS